jgi:hypothetical protein
MLRVVLIRIPIVWLTTPSSSAAAPKIAAAEALRFKTAFRA